MLQYKANTKLDVILSTDCKYTIVNEKRILYHRY